MLSLEVDLASNSGGILLLKHQPWNPPGVAGEAMQEFEWNLWRIRQFPYDVLEDGQRLLTVSGGGPKAGRIMNQVQVLDVLKAPYDSHEEAWALVEDFYDPDFLAHFGWSESSFLEHSYLKGSASTGYILAWWGDPLLIINKPRPYDLRFRQNGWAEVADESLAYIYSGAIEVPATDP